MMRIKRICSWCETSYYVTIWVFCGVFLIIPYQTHGTDPVYLMSESCSSADDSCGPSSHRLICGPMERLAVVEASHGFQSQEIFNQCWNATAGGPCSLQHCCRYNSSTDCRQPFSAEELDIVRTECSYRNSCQISQTSRANNSDCSTDSLAPTSTYSFLRALCIPESIIADPCSDVTVTGRLVSLFSPPSPSPNHCNCQLHLSPTPTNTTTTTDRTDNNSDTTDGSIEINTYEVEGVGEGEKWWVRVVAAEGRVVVGYADGGKRVFPTTSVSTPLGSLPLSVELGVGGGTRPPRVWVGFTVSNVSSSTLVLRCGANASLNNSSSGTDETTIQSAFNNSETTTTTTTTTSGASSGRNNPTIQDVTENPAKVNSQDTTTISSKDDGGLDTTDIIVYAAIGLSALLFFSFTYVCVRKIRRKGCPKWCPPYCRDLECGRDVDKTTNDSNHDPTTATTTTQQTTTSTTTTRDGNSSKSSQDNHKTANGSITPVAAAAISTYGSSDSLPLSAAAFHQREFKRHRSLASMHRPSLDNIRESEEESQFPTHHKHSNIDLAEAFRILDQRLHHHHHPNSHHHHHHSHVTGDLAVEEHDEHEEEGPVVFHLGSNESSEHDLEQHADKD